MQIYAIHALITPTFFWAQSQKLFAAPQALAPARPGYILINHVAAATPSLHRDLDASTHAHENESEPSRDDLPQETQSFFWS